mmetsp:Transcript_61731/g.156891  ORF Transcript_61731/g.156891 Transcript_61731/m.156891 type:complete len:258 (+) Transcript_61731:533-1306(+)
MTNAVAGAASQATTLVVAASVGSLVRPAASTASIATSPLRSCATSSLRSAAAVQERCRIQHLGRMNLLLSSSQKAGLATTVAHVGEASPATTLVVTASCGSLVRLAANTASMATSPLRSCATSSLRSVPAPAKIAHLCQCLRRHLSRLSAPRVLARIHVIVGMHWQTIAHVVSVSFGSRALAVSTPSIAICLPLWFSMSFRRSAGVAKQGFRTQRHLCLRTGLVRTVASAGAWPQMSTHVATASCGPRDPGGRTATT